MERGENEVSCDVMYEVEIERGENEASCDAMRDTKSK
jgi:hypothetical protein